MIQQIYQNHPSEKWQPSRVSTHDIFRAIQLSLNAAMAEPMTQVKTHFLTATTSNPSNAPI